MDPVKAEGTISLADGSTFVVAELVDARVFDGKATYAFTGEANVGKHSGFTGEDEPGEPKGDGEPEPANGSEAAPAGEQTQPGGGPGGGL